MTVREIGTLYQCLNQLQQTSFTVLSSGGLSQIMLFAMVFKSFLTCPQVLNESFQSFRFDDHVGFAS